MEEEKVEKNTNQNQLSNQTLREKYYGGNKVSQPSYPPAQEVQEFIDKILNSDSE